MKATSSLSALIVQSFFAIAVLAVPLTGRTQQATVGSAAPDFTVTDSTGKEVSLHDFKGKIVVLEWFNPNCPFIKKFYSKGDMQRFQEQTTSQGVVCLTVSSSAEGKSGYLTKESATSTRQDLNMKSTALLLDGSGNVGKLYGARTTPHLFVVDSFGTLSYTGAIDSSPSADSDDVAGATNYVLGAIEALKAGKPVTPPSTEPYGCSVKY